MLAFARPSFKVGEKTDEPFSHYENYYKCSRCGYEMRESKGKGNMNMMKEEEHENDQDDGDNGDDEGEEGDDGDEVDSWQRRRNLK